MLIQGLDKAIAKLKEIHGYQGDLRTLAETLFDVAQTDIQTRFASSPRVRTTAEVYGGVTWQRLSERYIEEAGRGYGVQLVDTGELRKSFRMGQSGNVAEASTREVRFGSDLQKAFKMHRRRSLVVEHEGLTRATEEAIAGKVAE